MMSTQNDPSRDDTLLTNAELVQLRIRVIALENLVIALLAGAPGQQLALAREMATYISPRTGFTPHPVTLRAADEMLSLIVIACVEQREESPAEPARVRLPAHRPASTGATHS